MVFAHDGPTRSYGGLGTTRMYVRTGIIDIILNHISYLGVPLFQYIISYE